MSTQRFTSLRLSRSELLDALRAEPEARRSRLAKAARDMLERVQGYAQAGRGLLTDVLGRRPAFEEWAHYPERDARDAQSGFRFYYHAHAARQRARGEHGHFHVFASTPQRREQPDYTHLIGISVDERGFPTRVFTTNRWVTAEQWLPAAEVLTRLQSLDLSRARPGRVGAWIQDAARLFSPQITAVVHARDHRIAQRAGSMGFERALEDRRTHIVSQCPVGLAQQFELLEAAGIGT